MPRLSRAQAARLPQAEPLVLPDLAAHRARMRAHRAGAFVRFAPVVAGFVLRPVSLRSLERLEAFEVDLVRGHFEDLAGFVWLHHPAFGQFAGIRRRLVVARLRFRLTARWPRTAQLLVFAGELLGAARGWRRLLGRGCAAAAWVATGGGRPATTEARLAAAVAEARAVLSRARRDWPAGDDSGAAAGLPCSFAAYVLNLVKGRHPQLTIDEILDMPLVELVQWLRALLHERNPRVELLDQDEARILAEALSAPLAEKTPAAQNSST